jgi:hypothetical protein
MTSLPGQGVSRATINDNDSSPTRLIFSGAHKQTDEKDHRCRRNGFFEAGWDLDSTGLLTKSNACILLAARKSGQQNLLAIRVI